MSRNGETPQNRTQVDLYPVYLNGRQAGNGVVLHQTQRKTVQRQQQAKRRQNGAGNGR